MNVFVWLDVARIRKVHFRYASQSEVETRNQCREAAVYKWGKFQSNSLMHLHEAQNSKQEPYWYRNGSLLRL